MTMDCDWAIAVSISLPVRLLCAQHDEQRRKNWGFEFLSPRCGPSRLSDKDYLTSVREHMFMWKRRWRSWVRNWAAG